MKALCALVLAVAGLAAAPLTVAQPSAASPIVASTPNTSTPNTVQALQKVRRVKKRKSGRAMLSSGGEHSCRIAAGGKLWCWGRNNFGQLGDGTSGNVVTQAQELRSNGKWKFVAAGGAHTCAIRNNGRLFCWGVNNFGQLGVGSKDVQKRPTAVVGGNRKWKRVEAGWYNTCGITDQRKLLCWGDNAAGQLGQGDRQQRVRPVALPGRGWKDVSVGSRFACATKTNGSLWCWGGNLFGQLGTGSPAEAAKPRRVEANRKWAEVSTSWTHTCARTRNKVVFCWGRNTWGQVGDGTTTATLSPRRVSGARKATAIATTEGASCLMTKSGRVWCWGNNAYGLQGNGEPFTMTPVAVSGSKVDLDGGWRHLCALTSSGASSCWGENDQGQLGNGTLEANKAPVEVETPPAADPTGATTFRVATLNVLGNGHTRPYAHDDRFGPATTRMGWLADQLDYSAVDILGMQEPNADQVGHFLKAARGTWDVYPRPEEGDNAAEAAVAWRTSVWDLVDAQSISTIFIARHLPRPLIRLRHKVTGKEVVVLNVHNAPWDYQPKRDRAVAVQIAKIQEVRALGLPVLYIGDMNEKRTVLCKVTTQTDLVSPYGGGYDPVTGACSNPPARMRVDWIFGSPDLTYSNFAYTRPPLIQLTTDHNMALVDARLP